MAFTQNSKISKITGFQFSEYLSYTRSQNGRKSANKKPLYTFANSNTGRSGVKNNGNQCKTCVHRVASQSVSTNWYLGS